MREALVGLFFKVGVKGGEGAEAALGGGEKMSGAGWVGVCVGADVEHAGEDVELVLDAIVGFTDARCGGGRVGRGLG